MVEQGSLNPLFRIEQAKSQMAGKIKKAVLSEIRREEFFPLAEVGRKGKIVSLPVVIVWHGYPISQNVPVPSESLVLTPKGLFRADCIKTAAFDKRYSMDLPTMETLHPATADDYITYGEKALILLTEARKREALKKEGGKL